MADDRQGRHPRAGGVGGRQYAGRTAIVTTDGTESSRSGRDGFDLDQRTGQRQRHYLQSGARRFQGLLGGAEKLRVTGLQACKVKLAAGFLGPHQIHPQLHDIAQIKVLLPEDIAQFVEHRNALHFSVAIGGRRTRRSVWVGKVGQSAADEHQAGRGWHGHGLRDWKIADAGTLNAVAHGVTPQWMLMLQ
ncbi:type III effector HopV1 [Pseudomonas amygdali pv. mori]|nr:type III effector HopV1 [Pseudomonas amygdali pv. mori]